MLFPNVNAHIHTPYSFSAFEKLTDVLDKASDENVKIVGINDFYSMDGYEEWNREAYKRHLYPLFNIEFICLQPDAQEQGIRVNDPNNPGRTYISGKGLCCPPKLNDLYIKLLDDVRNESNKQVMDMCRKVNQLIKSFNAGFSLNFNTIKDLFTKGLVRERHLAKALRMSTYIHFKNKPEDINAFFKKIFRGKPLQADIFDFAGVENEIRSNLLKAGGEAFVPEGPKAFLPLEDVCKLILAAGGIPTYPFLGDDNTGSFTEFENDIEKTAAILKQKGIFSAEFITARNSIEMLETYAGYLYDNGFIVTFGSEHNTPAMEPVKLSTRGKKPLSEKLKQINYEGACVIAAHQERINSGKTGFVDANGNTNLSNRIDFISEGDTIIQQVMQ
jgi:hypothetical protein